MIPKFVVRETEREMETTEFDIPDLEGLSGESGIILLSLPWLLSNLVYIVHHRR